MLCLLGCFVIFLVVSKWVKYFRINYGINYMCFKVILLMNLVFFWIVDIRNYNLYVEY